MEEVENENHPMLYSLCAVAAAAAILNAVFLLWQALKLLRPKGFTFVKYSLLLLDAFYSLTALALVLIVLYRDVGGDSLCDAGGYLIIAGSQLALWFQATSCISLLLWMKKSLSLDLQRRNGPIFALIACAQCLVIAVISALPFTDMPYFDATEEFYYTCTPLRLPGEKGWAYSTLLLILDWIAVVIGVVALVKISVLCSTCRQPQISAAEKLEELHAEGNKLRQQRQTFLTLAVCLAGWIAVLVIANITYFSDGKLDRDAGQWILGFCLSVTLCLRPLFNVGHQLINSWLRRNGHGLKSYSASLFRSRPSGLQRLARLPDSHQSPGAQKYLVQWRDEENGHLLSGTMKTFSPTAQDLWRNEINALEKLGHEGHSNLAAYLWVSPNNPFTQSICNSTGDPVSRHAGVICRMHFPNGTLGDFLRTRIKHLSETGLHKISLDVANGLEYLHQRSLVHNGLNSNAVFMASVSEKTGLKAVIGDLENSYRVSDDDESPGHLYQNKRAWSECDTTELFTISSRMALQQDSSHNKFAPDIRAFGLLVLEMLVALSQYKQKIQSAPRSRVSRLLEEVVRDATESEDPVDTSTPHEYHLHDDENCMCNNRVVDVRVHSGQVIYGASPEDAPDWRIVHRAQEADTHDVSDQEEELSLIPKQPKVLSNENVVNAAQNDGVDMCLTCGHTIDGTDNRKAHLCLDSPTSQGTDNLEDLCTSCQHDNDVDRSKVSFDQTSGYKHGSETPPKLSVRAFNVDRTKKHSKSKSQLQNPFTGEHVVELPEIGESDTESVASIYRPYARRGSYSGKQILTNGSFLTPRTTPELRTPTSRSDSSAATPTSVTQDAKSPVLSIADQSNPETSENKASAVTDVESRQDTPLAIKVKEIGFQTIYEEDENQNGTLPTKTKPHIPPKPRRLLKPLVNVKRRPPPPLPRGEVSSAGQTDIAGKRRFSMASLDESVISAADSGLGSSHYESSYCGSEISSIYLQPGSRNTIYSGSMSEGSEMYCPVKPVPFVQKPGSTTRIADSGVESSADSCGQGTNLSSDQGSSNANQDNLDPNSNEEDSVNNTYEQLPDIPDSPAVLPRRKEKQPCVGHHEHLENSPCKFASDPKKTSVTISTQTTDSLERPKNERRESFESSAESGWKTLVDKASSCDESDYQMPENPPSSHKQIGFSQTSRHTQSIEPYTVRQKTLVHQETVHSQPVYAHIPTYPQKLHPPHIPPKQIYTQSPQKHHYYETDPKTDCVQDRQRMSYEDHYDYDSLPNYYGKNVHTRYGEETSKYNTDHQYHKRLPDTDGRFPAAPHQPSLQMSTSSTLPSGGYQTPWSDYRHNLAYYKNPEPQTHENYRSAFRKPPASSKTYHNRDFDNSSHEYSGHKHHETDEEKLSHVLDKLKKEGRLGVVAGQLMPLLTECYSEDPAPSADDVINRLEQVLPTARV